MCQIIHLQPFLDGLNTGVAVIDGEDWTVLFENARFAEWFPADAPASDDPVDLATRIPVVDVDRARARLERGRPYRFETEVGTGAKAASLAVEVRRDPSRNDNALLVEAQNVSKQKEAEYMLDSYSRVAEKHARELQKEKDRVEKLLLNVMPRPVYEEMKEFGMATPQRFEAVSVLMLDFVGFTEMAISQDPSAIVAELNDIFSAFDRIVELFGCERIKTIGDGYVAVSGLPEANPEHAASIAKVALRMRRYLQRRNASHSIQWECRIGIATGPLIGSLIGVQKYVYDIFGPAANLSARLEALSQPMEISVSEQTWDLIEDEFELHDLGEHEVRGFGRQRVYRLDGEARAPAMCAPQHLIGK